ncbi:unnamed protein product [Adineta ricciae]|uniref:Transposase n=1 Tax=Adineta ricciae TaxID=249248 RepID=A0A815MI94_ADIRI|nr:unnamed protein product [Adineta ricciae]CAF1424830.1 unnamed protein product [Adineta ricciae]
MDMHPKKVMLSVWWGMRGIIHWELLPNGYTITADLYWEQLDRIVQKLKRKQDQIYFLHDNARPHVAKLTRERLLQLGWITISHTPYSPDLAPTNHHLFRSLSNYLSYLKSALATFFDRKSPDFYEQEIFCLRDRWRQAIETDGAYIDEN